MTWMLLSAVFFAPVPEVKPKSLGKELAALERKLHGKWEGGACIGELTIRADGTFERRHYSPGNNTLTGTWAIRWAALPPTLVLTCKASDEPDRHSVGKTAEVKLIELNDRALVYQHPGGGTVRYTRPKK